jgi:hypothetical protein
MNWEHEITLIVLELETAQSEHIGEGGASALAMATRDDRVVGEKEAGSSGLV